MVSHEGSTIHASQSTRCFGITLMSSSQVWLMRHGETEANRLGIVQGQNATPLNEVGIQQSKTSAQALARTPFSHIFCSDLVRTRQTVEPLVALCAQHTVTYDARLREKGAGTAEGLKLTAFHKMQRDSGQNVRVYKPEGGESWDDVRSRAGSFYEHLLQMMRQGVEGPVLVVSHGGARIFNILITDSLPNTVQAGFIMEMVNTVVPNFSASNSAPNLSLTKLLISQPVLQYCTPLSRVHSVNIVSTSQTSFFQSSGRLRTQVISWADVSYMQQMV